jgi:FSR family fosmidomycin resistance protein-like MFS transporter
MYERGKRQIKSTQKLLSLFPIGLYLWTLHGKEGEAHSMERKKVVFLGFMHFLLDSYMGFFPIYLVIARLDPRKAALIITSSSFAGNLLQPFMGYASDRVRGKLPLCTGMLLASISMSAIGMTRNYLLLFFLVLFGHLGSSLFHPAGAHVSSAAGRERKDTSFALFSTIGTFGFALSQPIFSAFTDRFGTSISFLLAVPTILTAVLFLQFSDTGISDRVESLHYRELGTRLMRRFFPISLLFLIMVFRSAFVYSMNSFVAKTFEEWGFSRYVYSSANTVFMISGALGILTAGYLSVHVKPRRLVRISLAGFFPFFVFFLYFGIQGKAFPAFLFLSLCGFVLHGGYGTNIVMGHRIAPEMMSTISGILMGFAWAASSFGPTLCAYSHSLFPRIGGFASGLLLLSLFPLIATGFSLFLPAEVDG